MVKFYSKIAPATMGIYLSLFWLKSSFDYSLLLLITGAVLVIIFSPSNNINHVLKSDFFIVLFLLSLLLSIYRSGHLQLSMVLSFSFIPSILIYLLLSRFVLLKQDLWLVIGGLSLGVVVLSTIILFVNYTITNNPEVLISSLPSGVLIVPNDILLISICMPMMLALIKWVESRILKTIGVVSLLICFLAILGVNSRLAFLAAAIGISIVAVQKLSRKLIYLVIAGISSLLLLEFIKGYPLISKFTATSPLCETRLPLWGAALQLWIDRPWFGYGTHNYVDLYGGKLKLLHFPACSMIDQRITPWPHNLFLELLSSQGIVGTMPIFMLIVLSIQRTYKATQSGDPSSQLFAIGLLGALTAFILAAFFEASFIRHWVVIMTSTLIGLSAALESEQDHKQNTAGEVNFEK